MSPHLPWAEEDSSSGREQENPSNHGAATISIGHRLDKIVFKTYAASDMRCGWTTCNQGQAKDLTWAGGPHQTCPPKDAALNLVNMQPSPRQHWKCNKVACCMMAGLFKPHVFPTAGWQWLSDCDRWSHASSAAVTSGQDALHAVEGFFKHNLRWSMADYCVDFSFATS